MPVASNLPSKPVVANAAISDSGNTWSLTTTSSFESADGQAWLRIATVTIAMPDAIQVGLAVTSHRDGVLSTAMFDQVRITTAPVANQ